MITLKNKYTAILLAASSLINCGAFAEPVSLDNARCREMALSHSETLRQARNKVSMSDLDKKIATTAYLPKFDGSATGMYMLPDIDMMGAKMQVRGAYMAGIQLVQPIYTGGKITSGRKLAGIGAKVAREQLSMSRADVLMDVDNAYWTYVAVLDKVRLMDSYRSMMDTLYSQTATAVEAGMAVGNDLLRITAKRSEIEYQCGKAANGAELCRMALCNIIGLPLDAEISIDSTVPDADAPGVLDGDIENRPEYHLLQLQEDAARQQVNMVRSDFLPTIGLSIGYNYYGNIKLKGMADVGGGNFVPYTQEYRDGIAMGVVSVSIPLFHWGEGVKKVRKAKLDVENATLEKTHTRNLLELEARQAATNLTDGWNMIKTAETALQQALENLRVMKDRYEESVATLTDLLDAQTQWQQARSNMIEARTQYRIYHTAWLKATGRL